MSFEELRAEFVKARQANNPSQYVRIRHSLESLSRPANHPRKPEDSLLQKVNTAYNNVLSNLDQAVNFARSQSKKVAPPAAATSAFGSGNNSTPFGAPARAFGNTNQSAFGSTNAFGAQSSPANGSAFGQPASTGAFGQSSAFGTPVKPAGGSGFGAFASSTPSTSAFGQASAFGGGKPAFGTSAFGERGHPVGKSTI